MEAGKKVSMLKARTHLFSDWVTATFIALCMVGVSDILSESEGDICDK